MSMNTCREKTIQLLNEIAIECNNAGIKYFVSGELALFELKKMEVNDLFNNGAIIVFAKDVNKLIEILSKRADRKVEGLYNNSKFPGFYIRYMDTNTTIVDYSEANLTYNTNSLGINIEILCGRNEKTIESKILNRLKRIWVRANMPYYMQKRSRKKLLEWRIKRKLFGVIAHGFIMKWLFEKWIYLGSQSADIYKMATTRGKNINLNTSILSEMTKTKWIDGEFNIVKDLDEYIAET